jgi:hypothetical protein
MPVSKSVRFGVWEDGRFIGAVIFGWGANHNLSKAYGLDMTECVELVRVAMRAHVTPVSQVVAACLRKLHQGSPGLRVVVSFADPARGHVGGIYKAGNWIYLGMTPPKKDLLYRGQILQRRDYTGTRFNGQPRAPIPAGAVWIDAPGKHRYAYPLDRAMRRQLTAQAQPYPRGQGLNGEPSSVPDERAGSIPAARSSH